MLGIAGVIAIETSAAGVIVRVAKPVIAPNVALIVVCPVATLTACPEFPAALLIVATPVPDEAQVTELVRFNVLPSL